MAVIENKIIGATNMEPSELRFTHNNINNKFTDEHSLQETFRQFLYGELEINRDKVRPLVAMHYQGYWFVIRGNRRLYIYQKLESIGQMSKVKVLKQMFDQETFDKQFTTQNMGISLTVRKEPNIDNKLNTIVRTWQKTGQQQRTRVLPQRPKEQVDRQLKTGDTPLYRPTQRRQHTPTEQSDIPQAHRQSEIDTLLYRPTQRRQHTPTEQSDIPQANRQSEIDWMKMALLAGGLLTLFVFGRRLF